MKAIDYTSNLNPFLRRYVYQPDLTKRLDNINAAKLTQELINEIVLWKVNRYVDTDSKLLGILNGMKTLTPGEHRKGEEVLASLLETHGADLPMASTILRFRNPDVFQIIDRHAYRAIYDKKYPLFAATPNHRKITLYFDYLDKLIELCHEKSLDFRTIDRLLYIFDKDINGKL